MNLSQRVKKALGESVDELGPKDIRRIVNEFTAGLKKNMLDRVKNFDPEYTGMHVRALAQLLVEDDNAGIKKAKKELIQDANIRL